MRCTINTTANNPIRDRQDRTNLAGVDVPTMHLTHVVMRLHSGLAGLESTGALAGGNRALKPAFPGAICRTEQAGSTEPRCSVVGQSYRPWSSPRAVSSRAFAAIT